jgi:type IV secretory pathway VirB6-like protein
MKDKNDYNSIDRIRSCTTQTLDKKYKLPLDLETKNDRNIGVIPDDDLLKFESIIVQGFKTISDLVTGTNTGELAQAASISNLVALMFPPAAAISIPLSIISAAKEGVPPPIVEFFEEVKKLDYNYRITNEKCLIKSIGLFASLKLAIRNVHSRCKVKGVAPSIIPRPINDFLIIGKGMKKIGDKNCRRAMMLVFVPFNAYFVTEIIVAVEARKAMKRARLCGHNWNSWNPTTKYKNQIGLYQRKVKICVECRLGILDPEFCSNTIGKVDSSNKRLDDSDDHVKYKKFCNDNHQSKYNDWSNDWSGKNIKELLQYRKYREYIYRGVEREDRFGNDHWKGTLPSVEAVIDSISRSFFSDINMKYCIDPTKKYNRDHGDIMKAYYIPKSGDYKFHNPRNDIEKGQKFGPFAVQKYYYRGTSAPEFNCNKYLQEPKIKVKDGGDEEIITSNDEDIDQMRQIYRDAYECCMRKKHGSICVEYTSDTAFHHDDENSNHHHGGDYYIKKYEDLDFDDDIVNLVDDDGNDKYNDPVTNTNYRICNANEVCSFGPITGVSPLPLEFDSEYITTDSGSNISGDNLLCAHTISLCPFDFNIGGATAICDNIEYDAEKLKIGKNNCSQGKVPSTQKTDEGYCIARSKIGTCSNYCQMLNHCVIVDRSQNHSNISINSPYFDKACFDFKGASKYNGRSSSWDIDIIPGNITRLTSPIAQCARETMRNIFFNIAGHDKCLAGHNHGNYSIDRCPGDLYKWKKGEKLDNITNDEGEKVYFSFFEFLQDKLYIIIQAFFILYVMIFGMKFFMADKAIPRDKILMSCLKLAVAMYFATGQAWQTIFFDLIYYTSITLGNIILDLKNSSLNLIMEGGDMSIQAKKCYFEPSKYIEGMEYVAIWDMFDCKLSQYLGLGPGFTLGNLAILIISGFFTGPYGVKFASLLLIFAAMFITIIYIILYTFVIYSATILVLIFISPMMMVALLFDKTKQMIFDNWFRQLMESATQIIILFSFVSLVMFVFDSFFIGSAKFTEHNDSPDCSCSCKAINNMPNSSTNKHFIEDNIKKCSVTDNIASQMDDKKLEDEKLDDSCSTKFTNAKNDENGKPISDDRRLIINCGNIYDDGLCEQRDGFKILDPKGDSLICIMRIAGHSITTSSNLAIFGIAAPILNAILSTDRAVTLVLTLVKLTLMVYIIQIMTLRIVSISAALWGTKGISDLSKVNIGMNNQRKELTTQLSKLQSLASKGAGKKSMQAFRKGAQALKKGKK